MNTRPGSRPQLYPCFDFVLRSDLPLTELATVDEPDGRAVVDVRTGAVPALLDAPDVGFGLRVDGSVTQLTVPRVARYRISDGRGIVIEPHPDATERAVRLFLLGSALGILCYQRGLLLLHANAVVVNGAAFAFAGASGAGKSTLAAYFHRAGRPVLCDDVCAVSFDAAGRPLAWPGLPRLKLWGTAAEAFAYDRASLDLVLEGMDKFHVPLDHAARRAPVPLRALYLLERAADDMPGTLRRLRGVEAIKAILDHSYRGQYVAPMGLTRRHFDQSAALLRGIEVHAAARAWGFDVFEREAERLAAHLDAAAER